MSDIICVENQIEFCSKHVSKPLEVICDECRIPLCSKCISSDHRGHSFSDIDDKNQPNFRNDIRKCIAEKTYLLNMLLSNRDKVQEYVERFEKQACIISEIVNQIQKNLSELSSELTVKIDNVNVSIEHFKELLGSDRKAGKVNTLMKEDFEYNKYLKYEDTFENNNLPMERKLNFPLKHLCWLSNLEEILNRIREHFQCMETKKIGEIKIAKIDSIFHMSKLNVHGLLIGDDQGNLVIIDEKGNVTQRFHTCLSPFGYFAGAFNEHTFYFLDASSNTVKRVVDGKSVSVINVPKVWSPRCIFISKNNNMIIGMENIKSNFKVTIYNSRGKKLQDILRSPTTGDFIFSQIIYVCENVNGDICASQCKISVISVTRDGEVKFTYTGCNRQSSFLPGSICCDIEGNIFVCNTAEEDRGIHLINMQGIFLRSVLEKDQCPSIPLSVLVDNSCLHVGWYNNSFITFYNYDCADRSSNS